MVTVLCASRNNHIFRLALGDFNYTFIKRQRQTKKNKLNKEGRAHKQIRCREKSTEQFPELTTRRRENIQKKSVEGSEFLSPLQNHIEIQRGNYK